MKRVLASLIVLLFMGGCGVLSPQAVTEDNPLGVVDVNQAVAFFTAGQQAAALSQTVGAATGNPALVGGGALAGVIVTLLGASYLKGKKK